MEAPALPPGTTQRTLAIIMGGGAGTRLFPLTKDRAKPAVPLGGKYRIVDIPISNCLNSGLRSIYVLTQFNSMSLHRHIQASYKFDNFSRSFIDILAAQQTPEGSQWYQGTADAVRQNMRYFLEHPFEFYLILSGDQLYRMDFRSLLHQHIRSGAEITLATKPVKRDQASDFGIMSSGEDRRITRFVEKPKEAKELDAMKMDRALLAAIGHGEDEELLQASMGIYIFNRNVLIECLNNDLLILASSSFRLQFKRATSAPTFSMATGRISERFAPFMKPISISPTWFPPTVSSNPMRRFIPIRGSYPAAKSTVPPCARRSFLMAASSPMATSSAA